MTDQDTDNLLAGRVTHQQAAFEFLAKNKRAIKLHPDQALIKEYNRVLMALSKRCDELEKDDG